MEAVITIVIIIIVYSTTVISCSPSFVKGGCIFTTHWFCKDTPLALVSIGHDTYLGGSSTKGLHRTGVRIPVFRLVNSWNLKYSYVWLCPNLKSTEQGLMFACGNF